MRRDLTERELYALLDRLHDRSPVSPMDLESLKRVFGELMQLRNREAHVMHMHNIEGAF